MAVQNERNQESNIYNDNFRNQYPPAQVGADAYNRAISRNLEESRLLNQQTESTYVDMYNRNRRQNYNRTMMGAPQGVTGGMLNQYEGAVSAAQMRAANQIGVQRERSMRDIQLNRMAMDRAAIQEGYQAEDRARQTQMYNMQMEQQRQAILANEDMTDDQKMRMLMAGGMDYASAAQQVQPQAGSDPGFAQRIVAGDVTFGGAALAVGGTVVGGKSLLSLGSGVATAVNAKSYYGTAKGSAAALKAFNSLTAKKIFAKSALTLTKAGKISSSVGAAKGKFVLGGLVKKTGFFIGKAALGLTPAGWGIAIAAAIALGVYGVHRFNQQQKAKTQQTDYSNMMPAMG